MKELIDNIYWPSQPPKVIDHVPPENPKKTKCIRSVCKHYYNKCFERIKND